MAEKRAVNVRVSQVSAMGPITVTVLYTVAGQVVAERKHKLNNAGHRLLDFDLATVVQRRVARAVADELAQLALFE